MSNKEFLDLGYQPLANKYLSNKDKLKKVNEETYRLKVGFNKKTKLVSLYKKIPVKKMFNNTYPYKSSMSKTMLNSFFKLSKKIKKKFNPKMTLEIGSNDGPLVRNFRKDEIICVEPCANLAKITKKMGYVTYNNYWNFDLSKKLKKKFNKIDLIYSANTITHIENLNDVFKSIDNLLSKNGVLIIEDPSLLECIKKVSYDQFYNEHMYIFSSISLNNLLKKFNLEFFDIDKLPTHGGSLRFYIKRKSNNKIKIKSNVSKQLNKELNFGLDKFSTYLKFKNKVIKSKKKLIMIINQLKKANKKIIGYGATAKATTILNYCNLNNKDIVHFVDTTPDKVGKFMPGKNIKILKYNKKLINNADYLFLGAWNFKNEIFLKEKNFLKRGGKFITHVPFPKII